MLAVHRRLALNIEAHLLGAGVMWAAPTPNVRQAVGGILLAVRRRVAAHKVEARSSGAGVTGATPSASIHHTVHSMLPPVHGHLALEIEARFLGA